MAVIARQDANPSLQAPPNARPYEHVDLADEAGIYATAAIGDHPGCLELHLSILRWGPRCARALRRDLEWLKNLARARGKTRIVGVTIPNGLEPDHRWFKFTRAFGFDRQQLHQSAELVLQPDHKQGPD